jgi:hypothetical protein
VVSRICVFDLLHLQQFTAVGSAPYTPASVGAQSSGVGSTGSATSSHNLPSDTGDDLADVDVKPFPQTFNSASANQQQAAWSDRQFAQLLHSTDLAADLKNSSQSFDDFVNFGTSASSSQHRKRKISTEQVESPELKQATADILEKLLACD